MRDYDSDEKGKKTIRRFALIGAGLVGLLGVSILGSLLYTTYVARRDPAVQAAVQKRQGELEERAKELDAREMELKQNFFGTLEDIAKAEKPDVPAAFRPLYLAAYVDREFAQKVAAHENVFYEKNTGDVHIRARLVHSGTWAGMLLIREDATGGILSAHHYKATTTNKYDEILAKAEPNRSIWFGPDVKIVDHSKKSVIVVKGTDVMFEGSGETSPYDDVPKKMLDQFKALYARGPNAEQPTPECTD